MKFHDSFNKATQPNRIIIVWRYEPINTSGMMSLEEQQLMGCMEDALEEVIEKDGFATLAIVSTGDRLREWTYYAQSENEFMMRLNQALANQPVVPIEIHAEYDPTWVVYEKFVARVKA